MREFEIPPYLQVAMDQMDARNRARESERLRTAIEGPGEDAEWNQPLRLWSEHEISCAILRGPLGYLCGYALVPRGHPWWGLQSDDEVRAPRELDGEMSAEQAMDDFGVFSVFVASADGMDRFAATLHSQVQCHGGLTWAGPMPIEGAPWGWWLGFDCGHHQDAADAAHVPERSREFNRRMIDEFGAHVWTEDEVAGEVGRMALAIAEAR